MWAPLLDLLTLYVTTNDKRKPSIQFYVTTNEKRDPSIQFVTSVPLHSPFQHSRHSPGLHFHWKSVTTQKGTWVQVENKYGYSPD